VNAFREMTEGRGAGGRRKVERMVASVGAMIGLTMQPSTLVEMVVENWREVRLVLGLSRFDNGLDLGTLIL
jgi:hypothetical protein